MYLNTRPYWIPFLLTTTGDFSPDEQALLKKSLGRKQPSK